MNDDDEDLLLPMNRVQNKHIRVVNQQNTAGNKPIARILGDAILEDLHERKCIANGALLLTIRPLKIGSKKVDFSKYTPTER